MKVAIMVAVGTALAFGAASAKTPAKPHPAPAAKSQPTCGALTFRALPAGGTDGEQTAGSYSSRFARLELRATVKGGAADNYFVIAGGKRLAAAPAKLPDAAIACAAGKKMPKPEAAASSCTGDRFTLVISHQGTERLGLLYGHDGNAWRFCSAGTF